MEIKIGFSIPIVVAVVAVEILSVGWYSSNLPWGRYGERFFVAAICGNFGLALMLKTIIQNYWAIRHIRDMISLSAWVAGLYVCLDAPHSVYSPRSLTRFFFNALHKFALVFVMIAALEYLPDYH